MSLLKGWDMVYSEPGYYKDDEVICRTCCEAMEVKRNCCGPTSYVEAVSGGSGRLHDVFTCPHAKEMWHIQARMIRQEAETTPSRVMTDLLIKEVRQILETREPTKEISE